MVQEILLLTYSVLLNKHNANADDVRKAYYVFDDLEDSMFMVCSTFTAQERLLPAF